MPSSVTASNPVLALASGVRPWIVAGIGLRVGVLACYLGQGFVLAAMLGGLLAGRGMAEQLGPLGWVVVLLAARTALLWAAAVVARRTGARTTEMLRERAFAHLAELGPARLAGARTGEVREALLLTREALRPLGVLAGAFHLSYSATEAATRITTLLDTAPPAPARPGAQPAAALGASVRFDNVRFGYGVDRPVLHGFDLDVPAGSTVAVVGASGVGKTTLVSLLLRFVDPDDGVVRIGGHDVRELPPEQLRSSVALVAQDTYLFGGTIADNLRIAAPGATAEQMRAAATAAGLHDEIAALPEGYHTTLGERGVGLSGGQRQRLAIARAVLADAPILVLDEATASVDADSEATIAAALDRVSAGRTTLIIAHRLSTVRHADRIVVLEDGRVGESGRHDELIALGGGYARLVAAQHTDGIVLQGSTR